MPRRRRRGKRARRRNTFLLYASIPSCVNEVELDYRNWLFENEKDVVGDYMIHQPDLNSKMRDILFGWLIEVQQKFKLTFRTLFRAYSIIDECVSKSNFSRCRYQLIGITSLWIAAKIEEIQYFEVRDAVYICANAYKKTEFFELEKKIVCEGTCLTSPTILDFAEILFSLFSLSQDQIDTITKVLSCAILQYATSTSIKHSLLACACVLLVVPDLSWTLSVQYYSGYPKQQVLETIPLIVNTMTPFSKMSYFFYDAVGHFFKNTN